MKTVLLVFFLLFLSIFFMSFGVIFRKDKKKGELKGSCGGPEVNPDCCQKKDKDSSCHKE